MFNRAWDLMIGSFLLGFAAGMLTHSGGIGCAVGFGIYLVIPVGTSR